MMQRLGFPNQAGNTLIAACTIEGVLLEACTVTSDNVNREDFED